MSIFLVRHGETASNRQRIMQVESTELSTLGRQQAELLAQRLGTLGIGQILCSDLARARMTAAPLVLRSGAQLALSPLLRERDFGELCGTPYSALACDPFAPEFVPPRGESWEVFHARVAEAFALISAARRNTDANLVVITHGLVLRAILQRHVPWPQGAGEPPNLLANTSVTLLAGTAPHAPSLINCCAHLGEHARGTPLGGAA